MTEIDKAISEFFLQIQNGFLTTFLSFATHFGEMVFFMYFFCCIYWLFGKHNAYRFLILFVISTAVNQIIKFLVKRPRPFIYPQYGFIPPDGIYTSGFSFPSGHSTNISFEAMFGIQIAPSRWRKVVIPVAIFMSLLVGVSRIYLFQHFFTDVLVGLMMGSVLVYAMYPLFKKWKKDITLIAIGVATVLSILTIFFDLLGYNYVIYFFLAVFIAEFLIRRFPIKNPDPTTVVKPLFRLITGSLGFLVLILPGLLLEGIAPWVMGIVLPLAGFWAIYGLAFVLPKLKFLPKQAVETTPAPPLVNTPDSAL
ncbi:Undecaprenyl-diphosphatase BcrC [termite gut metagenome]|uniref:Undecaprenyl-diphosphatase BcrC n=1 Tax=termite gut metagenome TaxID=433724 RepID=A0A5J4RKD6_9ZZZZ